MGGGIVEWVIVGLGNPGPTYRESRHNAGFWVVERLADRAGVQWATDRSGALVTRATLAGRQVFLAEPLGYMNRSGGPTQALLHYYRIPAERLIVVHDDMDLPVGWLRVKRGGGHGGHNGLRSIHQALGTADYLRVKVGIGRPRAGEEATGHVLGKVAPDERALLEEACERAAEAVETIVSDGVTTAMNRFNSAPKTDGGDPAPPQPPPLRSAPKECRKPGRHG
jgi:PTH1 family peptidyl-tRNA hydrolase